MAEVFCGKWTAYKDSEEFGAYLDKIDVGPAKKKLALSASPSMEITVAGDTINIKMSFGPKSSEISFQLGEEYEIDGLTKATAITTFTDGKLYTTLKPEDTTKKYQVSVREVVNNEIVQTMTCDGVEAKRYFKKSE